MGIRFSIEDVCFGDYLTDHHNRDGEYLFPISCRKLEKSPPFGDVEDEIHQEFQPDELPEYVTDGEIKSAVSAIAPEVADLLENWSDEYGRECSETDPAEYPSVWILAEWWDED